MAEKRVSVRLAAIGGKQVRAELEGVAAEAAVPKTVMIDATYLKAHRTATSLRSKKGGQATKGAV